jgi:MFS family permease
MFTINKFKAVYAEYPQQFWLLMFATFVDRTGGTLLFPFFALYITKKFGVTMIEAGIVFLIFSVTSIVGTTIGGALTDRLGRKGVVIFGLVVSALSSLTMAFIEDLTMFYLAAVFVGLVSHIGQPARQAMIADLLPEEKRAEGFALLRMVINISFTLGPILGALIASYSFLWLFLADAITSIITAGIIARYLLETYQRVETTSEAESFGQTFRGYGRVFGDQTFMLFVGVLILMGLVYTQMYSTLSVFLRDERGFPEYGYGYVMSTNAAIVVLTQFWVTRRLREFPPMLVMALGGVLYAIGFGMYGFVTASILFFVAMIFITFGEMFALPTAQAVATRLAPDDMRGRYLAVFGLSFAIPSAIGPLMAGLILENADPNLLWVIMGALAMVSVLGFIVLHQRTAGYVKTAPAPSELSA